MKTMMRSVRFSVLGAVILLAATRAEAVPIISISDPAVATEIGARIRWGASGFEASLFDSNPFGQAPTLNPVGSPVWGVGSAYKFRVSFDGATGALSLAVDFDLNNSFSMAESITRTVFGGATPSYLNQGFNYLSISGNEGGSTGRSNVSNLLINGTSLAGIAPNGNFLEKFYSDSPANPMASIVITGDLTFTTPGTGQERPSWNFNFKGPADPVAAVPEPISLLLFGTGLSGLALLRRRK